MRRILASPSPNSNYTHLIVFSRILRGANASTLSNPNPTPKRRDLILLAALIEYPGFGLILYETGCAENLEVVRTYPLLHSFTHQQILIPWNTELGRPTNRHLPPNHIHTHAKTPRRNKRNRQRHLRRPRRNNGPPTPRPRRRAGALRKQQRAHLRARRRTQARMLGRSHRRRSRRVPEPLLTPRRAELEDVLEGTVDLFRGITLHHAPGHTPGLCMMQVNLERDGTFIWTSDMFHVRENFEEERAHGGLARDHCAWVRSLGLVKRLQGLFGATLVFGHDRDVAMGLMGTKYYE